MRKLLCLLLAFSSVAFAETNDLPTAHHNIDVNEQAEGRYPDLNRKESLPIGAIQHAWDEVNPGDGVYRAVYRPGEVIPIRTREYMTTTIEFPHFENIQKTIIGDEVNYKVSVEQPNIITLQPIGMVGLDTSLTLIGESGNVYIFYVRTEGYNSNHVSDLKVLVAAYAPRFKSKRFLQRGVKPNEDRTDYLQAVSYDPADLDFNYEMRGARELAPLRVYSDGLRTWFDYGSQLGSKTLPSIFILLDEVETPVMTSRIGNKIVAQGIGDFVLKSGSKYTCVTQTKRSLRR